MSSGVLQSTFLLKIAGTKYKNSICRVCVALQDGSGAFPAAWEVAASRPCAVGRIPNPVPWAAVEGRGTARCGVAAGLDRSPSTHTLTGGDHHQRPIPSLLAVLVEPRQLRKGTV